MPCEKSLAQLSDRWGRQLGCIVSFGAAQLKLCRVCNDACISRMPVPESYVSSTLARIKNSKDVLSKVRVRVRVRVRARVRVSVRVRVRLRLRLRLRLRV